MQGIFFENSSNALVTMRVMHALGYCFLSPAMDEVD